MKKNGNHSGVIVPLVTPFTQDGQIDEPALEKIVNYVVKNNCAPFILGTTGESASVSAHQYPIVARAMVKASAGRCNTYANISSTNTSTSLWLADQMQNIGVDAVVVHPPGYFPLSADHLLSYFENLAESIRLPIIIYNIPATTHHSIPLDVVEKLSQHPRIIGIKDSERDQNRLKASLERWAEREDFVHLLGWGAQFSNALINGSDGIIPSTGNITPHLYSCMVEEVQKGNNENVQHLQKITDQFSEIYQKGKLLSEALAGLKIILNDMGFCGTTVLSPLKELNNDDTSAVKENFSSLMNQMQSDTFGKHMVWP